MSHQFMYPKVTPIRPAASGSRSVAGPASAPAASGARRVAA
jgi:hypothetical protein